MSLGTSPLGSVALGSTPAEESTPTNTRTSMTPSGMVIHQSVTRTMMMPNGTVVTYKSPLDAPKFTYPWVAQGAAIPDTRLFMAELLIPNRKPIGNVRIDWSNPMAKYIAFFGIVTSGGLLDLVTDTLYPLPNASIKPKWGELVAEYDGVTRDDIAIINPISHEPNGVQNNWTFAVIYSKDSTANPRGDTASFGTSLGTSRRVAIDHGYNTYNQTCFYTFGATIRSTPSYAVTQGKRNVVSASGHFIQGGTHDFDILSVINKTSTGVYTEQVSAGTQDDYDELVLGGSRVSNYFSNVSISAVIYWKGREFSESEHLFWQNNPYQILKPI